MTRKKAVICTIMFSIIIIGVAIALLLIKPHGSEMSLLHAFSPIIVGRWLGEQVGKFYDWLIKNN